MSQNESACAPQAGYFETLGSWEIKFIHQPGSLDQERFTQAICLQ